jgi:YT521-B-like domain
VHKSLKFNIWASTEIGNRRLDKAYRESYRSGPIYLFFSVNARYPHLPGVKLTGTVVSSAGWQG